MSGNLGREDREFEDVFGDLYASEFSTCVPNIYMCSGTCVRSEFSILEHWLGVGDVWMRRSENSGSSLYFCEQEGYCTDDS